MKVLHGLDATVIEHLENLELGHLKLYKPHLFKIVFISPEVVLLFAMSLGHKK